MHRIRSNRVWEQQQQKLEAAVETTNQASLLQLEGREKNLCDFGFYFARALCTLNPVPSRVPDCRSKFFFLEIRSKNDCEGCTVAKFVEQCRTETCSRIDARRKVNFCAASFVEQVLCAATQSVWPIYVEIFSVEAIAANQPSVEECVLKGTVSFSGNVGVHQHQLEFE